MLQSMSTFLADLAASPVGLALFQQREVEQHSARQELLGRIVELRAVLDRGAEEHDAKLAPLVKACEIAKQKFQAAERTLGHAMLAKSNHQHETRHAIAVAERQLRASADPRITEAKHSLQRRLDDNRGKLARSGEVLGPEFTDRLKPVRWVVDNERAVRRLISAVQAARAACDALQLENPDDVDAAIAALLEPVARAWATLDELGAAPDA